MRSVLIQTSQALHQRLSLLPAMKRVDSAVYDIVEKTMDDKFQSGVITYDLASEGVDIVPTQDLLSQDVIDKVNDVKQQIVDGKIHSSKDTERLRSKIW